MEERLEGTDSYMYCEIILESLLPSGAWKMNVSMKICS